MTVKIKAALPRGDFEDDNGLEAMHDRYVNRPKDAFTIIARVRVADVNTDVMTGYKLPRLEIMHVEDVTDDTDYQATVADMLDFKHQNRTGKNQLPIQQ